MGPAGLRRMRLNARCSGAAAQITDEAVTRFGAGLPSLMQELKLNFQDCHLITDCGITGLALNLPATLLELAVDLTALTIEDMCALISMAGVAGFTFGLPATLRKLDLRMELALSTDMVAS